MGRALAFIAGMVLLLASGCGWHKSECASCPPTTSCCGDPRCRCMAGGPACSPCGCKKRGREEVICSVGEAPTVVATKPQQSAGPEQILHMPRLMEAGPMLETPPAPSVEVPRAKPELVVSKSGPNRRYVGKTLEHVIEVKNEGKAPATGVLVVDHLPPELKLADKPANAEIMGMEVRWRVDALPPGDARRFTIKTKAQQIAPRVLNRVSVSCQEGLSAEGTAEIEIIGLAALRLEVFDLVGTVAEGDEAEYVVRVTNQGNSPAAELQVWANASPELKPLSVSGQPDAVILDHAVQLSKLDLPPGEARTYRLRMRGERPGDGRVKVGLIGPDLDGAVVEEESTTVVPPIRAASGKNGE